ncbi:PH domain-containing protein [Streptomyces sp. MNU103]|uniref:PH domain-containing protein n=1 Tax=Streptomyces sp. MNU103 TaxID=2560024 RepID=UPI001E4BDACA|nr:PH domain-containing protein [Streptomyces sp. MNU103]
MLVLAIVAWLGIDAVVVGEGRTPWLALAVMLFLGPVVFAYTLRPAVFVNDDRLRIRNPLRLIVLPWGQVASLRSGFSNEVVDESGTKYQLWALPVSLRARSKAARHDARAARAAARADARGGQGGSGSGRGRGAPWAGCRGRRRSGGGRRPGQPAGRVGPRRTGPWTNCVSCTSGGRGAGDAGEVTVRWAYEIIAPAVAGAVLLGVLWGLG